MKVFNPNYFLRHISMPTLREFTEAQKLNSWLNMDWEQKRKPLHDTLIDAVQALEDRLQNKEFPGKERIAIQNALLFWQEDLRRGHMMSNELAIQELRTLCTDEEAKKVFSSRSEREISLWMLVFRSRLFLNAELHLAFRAKSNGRYWEKFQIQQGLNPTGDRSKLKKFSNAVLSVYKSQGAGKETRIEISERPVDDVTQLTIYVEGPVTAFPRFSGKRFKRIPSRITLETALLYHPGSGIAETVVHGGIKNHEKVLALFGSYIVEELINPIRITKSRFPLNVLRDGNLKPREDWSVHGIQQVRIRRVKCRPIKATGIFYEVEAPPVQGHKDALTLARENIRAHRSFDQEYDLVGATLLVYLQKNSDQNAGHFSFDIKASGSSTINNLSLQNQRLAKIVLQALGIIEPEQEENEPIPV